MEAHQRRHNPWPSRLTFAGGLAMGLGALDPLEGSVVILGGTALVLAGVTLGGAPRSRRTYWTVVFVLTALGIGAMFGLSAMGGVGGSTGRSWWWAVAVLPYPVGWLMGMGALAVMLAGRRRRPAAEGP